MSKFRPERAPLPLEQIILQHKKATAYGAWCTVASPDAEFLFTEIERLKALLDSKKNEND